MSEGAIPLTEIECYFRMFGIHDPDLVDEWVYLIRQMDREYLQVVRQKEGDS